MPRGKRKAESQLEPGGNTETPGSRAAPQPVQYFQWFFTLAQEHESQKIQEIQLWSVLAEHSKKFGFQLERGEGGLLHYQGWFSLKCKERNLILLKNMLGLNWIHLEPMKNMFAAGKYCSKSETRVKGPWTEKSPPDEEIYDALDGVELLGWQTGILERIKKEQCERDTRTINWFWEPEGCKGKTIFAKHMVITQQRVLLLSGKATDLKHGVVNYQKSTGFWPRIIFFNYVRSVEEFVSYQGLEEVKDGIFFSPKYEGGMVTFNSPVVIVLANFEPDTSKLSADRWNIVKIQ